MGYLSGKTVVISGAARGMGRAHALAVAAEGGNVVAFDICRQVEALDYPIATEEDLRKTRAMVEGLGGKVLARTADVKDQASVDAVIAEAVAEFGTIDGAVANAGSWHLGPPLWETSEDVWEVIVDTTLSGVWRLIKAVAPEMITNRSGAIVVISSVNGFEAGDGYGSYVVAKHGTVGLTRQAAYELAKHNVRVNAVAPGAIDTPAWNNEMGYRLFGASDRAAAVEAVYGFGALAGRSALPAAAVSRAVTWLLSEQADQVTGIVMPIDAGHLIQPGWNGDPRRNGPEADRHRPPAEAPE